MNTESGEILFKKWIESFLHDRSQTVVLNGTASDPIPVSSGVPQGSVLGPLLFLAYINDLPHNISSKVRLFADDTAIYLSLTSADTSVTLQNDLKLLEKWELEWDMQFNPSKCQVIHVTKRKHPIPHSIAFMEHFLNQLLQPST